MSSHSSDQPAEIVDQDVLDSESDDVLENYTYQALNPKNKDFRLLELLPGGDDENEMLQIQFRLSSAMSQLPSPPEYEALSYAWGDPTPTEWVLVRGHTLPNFSPDNMTSPNYTLLYIAKNLFDALHCFRSPTHSRIMWVDALCINQDDPVEKSSQVSMMPQIYASATVVLSYLGPEDHINYSSGAMHLLAHPVITFPDALALLEDPELDTAFQALTFLVQRPYFKRAWIVQELALAKDIRIVCGNLMCHWESFILVMGALNQETGTYTVSHGNTAAAEIEWKGTALKGWNVPDHHVHGWLLGLRDVMTLQLARDSVGRVSMKNFLAIASGREVSDPRDIIYSLVGMARNASDWIVDYESEVIDVFIDACEAIVERSQSLDILCHADFSSAHGHKHSWVPRFAGGYEGCDCEGYIENTLTISEILTGDGGIRRELMIDHSPYKAGGYYTANCSFDKENRRLIAKGMIIDTITKVLDKPIDFKGGIEIPRQWLEETLAFRAVNDKLPDEERKERNVEIFWRTVVADREQLWITAEDLECDIESIPNYEDILTYNDYRLWYDYHAPAPKEWSKECEKWIEGDMRVPDTSLNPFLKALYRASQEKRYVIMENSMGLGPRGSEEGDLVCILIGCSVPVILRHARDNNRDYEYNFIGEAYVHGVMNGEAVKDHFDNGKYERVPLAII